MHFEFSKVLGGIMHGSAQLSLPFLLITPAFPLWDPWLAPRVAALVLGALDCALGRRPSPVTCSLAPGCSARSLRCGRQRAPLV